MTDLAVDYFNRFDFRAATVNGAPVIQTEHPLTQADADWIKAHAAEILAYLAERKETPS